MGPDIAVLPGAGSFGGELRPLIRAFAPSAWLVRLPGRFGKDFGKPAVSFDEVVRSCVDQVRSRSAGRQVLLGNSFGAYVAYAAAARLDRLGTVLTAVVVVGAMPPHLFSLPESATGSYADLAAYLDDINPEIATSGDWRDVAIETARSDLELLRGFSPTQYGPLRSPILAARGENDPLTTTAGLTEWGRATRGAFSCRTFAGGHTDLLSDGAFPAWLREAMSAPIGVHIHQ